MKNTIFTKLAYFGSGILVGIALELSLTLFPSKAPVKTDSVCTTNAIVQVVETNRTSTTTQQVDWFKDNSNYIWDGWKIK